MLEINSQKYKIIEKIGKGTFGNVYKLEKNNKFYALKKISIKDLDQEEIDKIKQEAKILSDLDNENIIKYYGCKEEDDYFNIVMEYGGKSNLYNFIQSYRQKNENIEEYKIKDIILQICIAIKVIHENKIIHRDLKPENILINEDNKIKITDFGVSKKLSTIESKTNSQVGTQHYMALEIEKGEKYNNKVDIYSLGCIIYELFNLEEYYMDKILNKQIKINTDIYNPKWKDLIDIMVKNDYNERPTIEEVYNKIEDMESRIVLTMKINKEDIDKKVYFLDGIDYTDENNIVHNHDNLEEMNELNTILYIGDIKYKFKKYFIPKKEGLYTIKIQLNFLIRNCSYMFACCENIESIDLSHFDTQKTTNMSYMFYCCSNLKNINLNSLNTKNVEDINHMFYFCYNLKDINLSSFDTSKVVYMNHIFSNCHQLEIIDLSSFKTENLVNMECMFYTCKAVKNINISSFILSKVINMKELFAGCEKLESIDLSSLDINELEDINSLDTKSIFDTGNPQIEIKMKKNFYYKVIKDNPDYISNNSIKNTKIVDNYFLSNICILF